MISQKDMKIISGLRQDARQSLTRLSRKTGIPTSTLYDRIKLQESNAIKGYTTLVDFRELGFKTRATVMISARAKSDLQQFLLRHPSVNSLFKLGNGYDFLLEGVFRDGRALKGFIKCLKAQFDILELDTLQIATEMKQEGFLQKL